MGVVILLLFWIILIVVGFPIGISLILSCVSYLLIAGYGINSIVVQMFASLNSFPILAVPLFIFAANLMNRTGLTNTLFYFAKSLIGHVPGGLGHVNILASIFFSGMSGSLLLTLSTKKATTASTINKPTSSYTISSLNIRTAINC